MERIRRLFGGAPGAEHPGDMLSQMPKLAATNPYAWAARNGSRYGSMTPGTPSSTGVPHSSRCGGLHQGQGPGRHVALQPCLDLPPRMPSPPSFARRPAGASRSDMSSLRSGGNYLCYLAWQR